MEWGGARVEMAQGLTDRLSDTARVWRMGLSWSYGVSPEWRRLAELGRNEGGGPLQVSA